MAWKLRPLHIVRRGDGTLWTSEHPGYHGRDCWHFCRLRKALFGWRADYNDTWLFHKWPADAKVERYYGAPLTN